MKKRGKNWMLALTVLVASVFNAMATDGVIIPLTGHAGDKGHQIEWQIASLEDISFFIVQRSKDGENYKPLAMLRPKKDLNHYSFTDERADGQSWFYRVAIVDNDGVGTYTGAVYVEYAFVSTDEVEVNKPPKNIVINDHIAQEMNVWLNQLEYPTITKLGMVSNFTKLPDFCDKEKKK